MWAKLSRSKAAAENKAHVATYFCFATQAVLTKTVNSFTKDDCLDAVKRVCARRGVANLSLQE